MCIYFYVIRSEYILSEYTFNTIKFCLPVIYDLSMIRHPRFIEHTIPHPSLPVSICEHVHRHQSCRANFEGVNQAQIVCTNGVYLERLSRLLVRRDLTDRNVIVCPAPKFQESKFPPITCHGTATRTYSSRKTRKSDTLIT